MIYSVVIAPSARREVINLPNSVLPKIDEAIIALAGNPRPYGSVKLRGKDNSYRIRLGDYRIIYCINDTIHQVNILAVGHRREVYRQY